MLKSLLSYFIALLIFLTLTGLALPSDASEILDEAFEGLGTEGATCINCEAAAQKKPKNQKDLEAIKKATAKSIQNRNAKRPANYATPDCITCERTPPSNTRPPTSGVAAVETWNQFSEVMAYSNSDKVQKAIDKAMGDSAYVLTKNTGKHVKKRNPHRATGKCFRHVKYAVLHGGLVDSYLPGKRVNIPTGTAINAFKNEGFQNMLEDPRYSKIVANPASAPKGAVLIYSGGQRGGHIEIKTDFGNQGTYVSDFQAPNSITKNPLGGRAGNGYKLIGVMIKPGVS